MSSEPDALVCFSHLRWSFVYQRPQHVISRAARRFNVIFMEEPVFSDDCREPRLESRTETTLLGTALRVVVPNLPHGTSVEQGIAAQRRMLDEMISASKARSRVLWYYTPMPRSFSDHLAADLVVYDCMDELSAFANPPLGLRQWESELLTRADVVFTGGPSLYRAKRKLHRNVHEFSSSIDREHFARARARDVADPSEQASLARPRLGFFGVVDERMDLALVDEVAALRPQWSLVFIGPVVKIDPASLPRRPNIHWLGQRGYEQLPKFLAHWNVGIMPFAINAATRYISPTKTPEYLAGGVPVVSTPVPDVEDVYGRRGLVEIAGAAPEFVRKAEQAMRRPRSPWLSKVDRHLASLSWDNTFAGMLRAMADAKVAPRRSAQGAVAIARGAEPGAHV